MRTINTKKILRLSLVAILFALTLTYFGGAFMAAWSFSAPVCNKQPNLPANLPKPEIEFIETFDDRYIEIWIYPSQNQATIILLGGFSGSTGASYPPADYLLEAGYGVVQLAGRGCADPPTKVTLGYNESLDAEEVLQYILENQLVDEGKVGVVGFSMGGAAAIQAAARNPGFSAVVAEGGYANLEQNFKNSDSPLIDPFFSAMSLFFEWLTGVDPSDSSPIDVISDISPRPVFLIYGENEVVNGRGWEQYDAAKQPKQFWLVPDGTHGSSYFIAGDEYRLRILNFFDKFLLNE